MVISAVIQERLDELARAMSFARLEKYRIEED
jgi:hypothetical protein